jgi:hypothetical protein
MKVGVLLCIVVVAVLAVGVSTYLAAAVELPTRHTEVYAEADGVPSGGSTRVYAIGRESLSGGGNAIWDHRWDDGGAGGTFTMGLDPCQWYCVPVYTAPGNASREPVVRTITCYGRWSDNADELVLLGTTEIVEYPEDHSAFSDIDTDHWAHDEIEACFRANIVEGFPDGTYQPNRSVTRGEMAIYIARTLRLPTGPASVAY